MNDKVLLSALNSFSIFGTTETRSSIKVVSLSVTQLSWGQNTKSLRDTW